jgi:uncharacterized membrane protein YsdA (DUF1294 family)
VTPRESDPKFDLQPNMNQKARPAPLHVAVGLGAAMAVGGLVLLSLPLAWSFYLVLVVWLVCINLVTFAYYGYDKWQARQAGRRVPEVALHVFALVGGSLGAFAAMRLFRHKTIKNGFRIAFWTIVGVQLLACAAAAYGLWRQAT